jgi:RimJ/RimL family protein N-acetyltransferase
MNSTIIETDRILVRKFTVNDFEAVFEFGSNLDVQKYTGDIIITSAEQAKSIILDIFQNDYKNYGYGRWATIYKPNNKIIGFAGLKYLLEFNETDIGFRFLPNYWNKGIATEISKLLLDYGFKHFDLKRIIGIADPKNIGSCRVLEKTGMNLYKYAIYDDTDDKKYNWYQITK